MMLLFLFSQAARLEADDGVYTWSEMSGQNLPQLGWMQIGLKTWINMAVTLWLFNIAMENPL